MTTTLSGKPKQKASEVEPEDSIENLRTQLEEVTRQKEESERKAVDYLDRLQRLQADMENAQKIAKRQIEMVTKQASEGLLLKLLPIVDSLQQAANMAQTDNELPKEEIAVGLRMLLKQLTDVLKTEGLEAIAAVGRPLDPTLHEAVSSIEKSDVPENTIIEEVRRGYILKGKVIRHSLVIVSKAKGMPEGELEQDSEEE